MATQEVRYTKQRSAIIRAGMIVATINALLVLSLYLITGDAFKTETLYSMAFGMLGRGSVRSAGNRHYSHH